MKYFYYCIGITLTCCYGSVYSSSAAIQSPEESFVALNQNLEQEMTPKYLYRIISIEDWKNSQELGDVILSDADRDFIHLAKEDQLERISEKYWAHVPEFIMLKIDTGQLPGTLIYEANPEGSNKYYHLYNGSIPIKAVHESNTIKR